MVLQMVIAMIVLLDIILVLALLHASYAARVHTLKVPADQRLVSAAPPAPIAAEVVLRLQ